MLPAIARRCTVSTLSEIAANHAIKANALEAESARSRKPCSPLLQLLEVDTPAVTDQELPGPMMLITESNEKMYRHVTC